MQIKVRLYTILQKYAQGKVGKDHTVDIKKEATLTDLLCHLTIPPHLGMVFLVNNLPQDRDYVLKEGDEVKIFSLICGG